MAKMEAFLIDGDDREWHRTFLFGALEREPFASKNLWAVSFTIYERPFGSGVQHTFVVPSELASRYYMNHIGADLAWWQEHAVHYWNGPWSERYEITWRETPVHEHVVPPGVRLYYGLSCTKHPRDSSKFLMYVALGPITKDEFGNREYHHVFLVDDECCEPEYMDRMGGTMERWQGVCYDHPAHGHDPRTHDWWIDPDARPYIYRWFRK